ncbi:MAG: phosphatidate cytidylyltransferase [Niameybacter sp.]|uniref:phosphatidate cytidylyltransferase n=1 Tax=Niameybacter sp. TaxID=2033640 RepID=UPI002FCAF968
MLKRVLTAVIGIPFVILLIALGNPTLQIVGGIVALIGMHEFYQVTEKKYKPIKWLGYGIGLIFFCTYEWMMKHFGIFTSVSLIILLIGMVLTYPKHNIVDVALTLFAPLYVGLLLSFILMIRGAEYGDFLVWLIFISAWGSDTCAYFTGKLCGKHKLAPILSPKKTIEGAIGGAIGSGIIAYIYTVSYTQFAYPEMGEKVIFIVGIVFVSAILSQFGDLAASAIKRTLDVKDFGYIFPGHGGVLDRFDSILFVAPFIAIALECIVGLNLIA